MKILISSNSPLVPSGYAIQCFELLKVLKKLGHKVSILSWNTVLSDKKEERYHSVDYEKYIEIINNNITTITKEHDEICKDVRFYGCFNDKFPSIIDPNDINKIIIQDKFDIFIHLLDIWIIDDKINKFACKSFAWIPFHFVPIEKKTLIAMNMFHSAICLSNFGKNLLSNVDSDKLKNFLIFGNKNGANIIKNIHFIPHFIDFDYLYSKNTLDKDLLRNTLLKDKINIDDEESQTNTYLISMIAKNSEESNRKCFDMNLLAFKKLLDNGCNAYLYLHTSFNGKCNIKTIIEYYEIDINRIIIPDQYQIEMNKYSYNYIMGVYCASDVLLASTCSEGFGLPVLEAQLMGCPVVTTDCTAMSEYTYNGECAEVLDKRFVYVNDSYWYLPDPNSICKKVEKVLLRTKIEKANKREYGIKMVKENFNYDVLTKKWNDVLSL